MRPIYYTLTGATTPPLPVDRSVVNSLISVYYSGAGQLQYTTDDVFNVTPTNWQAIALVAGRVQINFPITALRIGSGGVAAEVLQIDQQGAR